MLDFRIQTFLTVCQTMNFTEAAKQLHMTQPAVSQHIHFLEKEYQATLFVYQNKRLSLTPAGTLLYKRLLTMQNDEKSIKEELKTLNTAIETLSLGVTMTVGEYAIVEKLAHYLKKHPQTNIHIHYGNTAHLLRLLDQGDIHMAIVEGNYPQDDYAHQHFSAEDYIAVCAASHQFNKQPSTMSDLLSERLLVREEGSGTRSILEQSLIAHGLHLSDFTYYAEVGNMHTIISLLKHDCGISFLYKIAVKQELASGELISIPLDEFLLKHDFDIIWGKNSLYTDQYLSFCDEFKKV